MLVKSSGDFTEWILNKYVEYIDPEIKCKLCEGEDRYIENEDEVLIPHFEEKHGEIVALYKLRGM